MPRIGYRLPNTIFRYVFASRASGIDPLVVLTVMTFLLSRTAGDPTAGRQRSRQGEIL